MNPLARYKWFLTFSVAVLSLICCSPDARGQRRGDLIDLVPSQSVAAAKFNWTKIRDDDHFRTMLNANQLDRALQELKISSSQISEIVIFSGINVSPNGLVGGIFEGTYDSNSIATTLEGGAFQKSKYLNRTIYCNNVDRSCTALLKSRRLVIGTQGAVEAVIKVENNTGQRLVSRKPFTTLLRKFVTGTQPITFAMALPLEYQMVGEVAVKVVAAVFDFSGLGPLGFVIDKIGLPQAIGFAIARSGNKFPTELIAKMKDEQSAALISGTFSLAQTINLELLSSRMPQTDRDMLKDMSVVRHGQMLTIKMTLRPEDLPGPHR